MSDLEKFYQKYQEENQPSWIFLVWILLFSFLIYKIFDKYGLKEIFNIINNFSLEHPVLIYFLAFISALVEGTIILAMAPGTMAVLIFGSLVASGSLNIFVLFPLVILGAFLGDNLGYYFGWKFEKKILKTGLVDPLQLKIAEKFLEDNGGKAITFSRFVNGIKEIIPFIAGSVKMDRKKFQIYNFLGAIGWAILWLGLGCVFYENLDFVEQNFQKIFTLIGILFAFYVYRYYQKNKDYILKDLEK